MTSHPDLALSPIDYTPDLTFMGRVKRRYVSYVKTAALPTPERSIITFSFDDFPKSAADNGADIMDSFGAKAIFYACSGLAGGVNLTGEQYTDTDMLALDRAGHEIGAHTRTHRDCAQIPTQAALEDIARNLQDLKDMGLDTPVRHFAYPYGETTILLKRALRDVFTTARGIRAGVNRRGSDRMQLAAMELTPDKATTARAVHAIDQATKAPVWLHIFTHDIRDNPSPFGTTAQELRKIVKSARDSGIQILTPGEAVKYFGNQLDA